MNILILTKNPMGTTAKMLIEAAAEKGHKAFAHHPKEFILYNSNKHGYDRLYLKSDRYFKRNFDVVIPRLGGAMRYGAPVLRHINLCMGVPSTTSAISLQNASNKLLCNQLLSAKKVRVPKTVFFDEVYDLKHLTDLVGGIDLAEGKAVVMKTLIGSQGTGVGLLRDKLTASLFLNSMRSIKVPCLLQEFIETSKKDESKCDLRMWIIGGKLVAAMKRYSVDGDFRANASLSGKAEHVTPTKEQIDLAVKAANALGLEIAGVDIFTDIDTGINYIVELNGCPGIKHINKVQEESGTGVNVVGAIIDYAVKKARKVNNTGVMMSVVVNNHFPQETVLSLPEDTRLDVAYLLSDAINKGIFNGVYVEELTEFAKNLDAFVKSEF